MFKRIEFIDFNIQEGFIDFTINVFENGISSKSDLVYFDLSENILVNNNLIALALSTLCGTTFDEIYIDLVLNEETINNITSFTNAKVHAKSINNKLKTRYNLGDGIMLNFSGGFDSLAALCLLPKECNLVSLEFGGWFEPEENFFKKFKPYSVKTNFRRYNLGYERNSHTFRGVAAILFSDYLKTKYNAFGDIFEASPWNFSPNCNKNINTEPFIFAKLTDMTPTFGLTEVGTCMAIAHFMPKYVNDSLISLAHPDTEKRYRKQLLMKIVSDKYNKDVNFEWVSEPSKKIDFGTEFAVDFLILYALKNSSIQEAEKTITKIPNEVIEFVKTVTLDFYEKYNANFLDYMPVRYRPIFFKKLNQAGINPFNQTDYEEFKKVCIFLSKYHPDILSKFY